MRLRAGRGDRDRLRQGVEPGGYRVEVLAFEEAADVCLTVRAFPPPDSTALDDSAPVEITADFAFTGEPDSLEVPLTLGR